MVMSWSYNEAEIEELCLDVLSHWSRKELLNAITDCELEEYIERCELEYDESPSVEGMNRFLRLRLKHWNKRDHLGYFHHKDRLEQVVWSYAEDERSCSNDFSEIYIDKEGYHRIALPED